ncbi:hypothetical protein CPSG_02739 [Coccidioides posadasii str. Silveira]|uniref:Uncharacterized protein n=1 Tax=Coccidioides posadasii (strain RMSCC 757 / Silveira) TaxID=443226 RepID=E9CY69_COCPS|nr:hypothetical protein CPSG_02739 [Coccidioides posadasii str. Silveira]
MAFSRIQGLASSLCNLLIFQANPYINQCWADIKADNILQATEDATQRNIDLSIMVYPDFYAGS